MIKRIPSTEIVDNFGDRRWETGQSPLVIWAEVNLILF